VSFILDALRKSEHERQRSALPSLSHVPTASPDPQLPRWATLVMGLLAATVLVLAGAWWQSERASPPRATVPAAVVERPLALPVPPSSPSAASPPSAAAPAALNSRTLADAVRRPPDEPLSPTSGAAATPAAAAPGEQQLSATPTAPGPETAVPSAAALLAQGMALPNLRLELHAYAEQPAARFVFINGRRYAEGERLSEGPDLVAIGPQGAVLSYRGQRFLLMPE
jgi:general secretion pathway protein B